MDLNVNRTAGGLSVEFVNAGAVFGAFSREMQVAAVLGMNRTAQEAVAEVRRQAGEKFIQRGAAGRRFIDLSFTVTQFATKSNPEIAFGISRALLQGRAALLIDHEDGRDRVARGRNDFPYVPTYGNSLRPTINDMLPRWAYPKALGLVKSGYLANGAEIGQDRTPARRGSKRGKRARENRKAFILRNDQGDPIGIFRRVPLAGARVSPVREGGKKLTLAQRRKRSTGQSTLELLFATPKVVKITPRLGFRRIAEHVMVERIGVNFLGMIGFVNDPNRQARNTQWARTDAALIEPFTRRRGR